MMEPRALRSSRKKKRTRSAGIIKILTNVHRATTTIPRFRCACDAVADDEENPEGDKKLRLADDDEQPAAEEVAADTEEQPAAEEVAADTEEKPVTEHVCMSSQANIFVVVLCVPLYTQRLKLFCLCLYLGRNNFQGWRRRCAGGTKADLAHNTHTITTHEKAKLLV